MLVQAAPDSMTMNGMSGARKNDDGVDRASSPWPATVSTAGTDQGSRPTGAIVQRRCNTRQEENSLCSSAEASEIALAITSTSAFLACDRQLRAAGGAARPPGLHCERDPQ